MIRQANMTDQARVVLLLEHSHRAAGFDTRDGLTGFHFPFDGAYAEHLFQAHMTGRRLVLVLEADGLVQGVLMAAFEQHPFGPTYLARETVWWIEPAFRGLNAIRMLDVYEQWARERGCDFVGMAGMGDDPDVSKLYQRRGFKIAETHYLKAL